MNYGHPMKFASACLSLLLALSSLMASAQSPQPHGSTDEAVLTRAGQLRYPGLIEGAGAVRLKDGQWIGPPAMPGAASRPQVTLLRSQLVPDRD